MSISQLYPEEGPSLNLNFAGSRILDPRITFTRTQTTSNGSTYMGRDGLIKYAGPDEPRFDHRYVNGEIESLGLLIEEQRTNLFTRSDIEGNLGEDPIGAIIPYKADGQSMLVSNDVFIGPNGLSAKHTKGSQGDSNIGYYGYNHTSGDLNKTHTISLYVYIPSSQVSGFTSTTVRISAEGTGVTSSVPGYADPTITDRWQRIFATYTPTSANFVGLVFRVNTSAGRYVYTDAWQLEQGSFVTSYMPSSGGSQFTRTADNASITGSNFIEWFNINEGTFIINHKWDGFSASYDPLFAVSTNGGGSGINLWNVDSGNGLEYPGTSNYAKITTTSFSKYGLTYNTSSRATILNGGSVVEDANGFTSLSTTNRLSIGSERLLTVNGAKTIQQLTYYPIRLSNSQLVALTR